MPVSLVNFLASHTRFLAAEIEGEPENPSEVPAGANLTDVDPNTLQDINFDDGEKGLLLLEY